MKLIYTDSEKENVGFVDISDPSNPVPLGVIDLNGEPTSVAIFPGSKTAAAAVNTSDDYVNTSGVLVIIDVVSQEILNSIDLGGQPDSVAISPDGKYIAVAVSLFAIIFTPFSRLTAFRHASSISCRSRTNATRTWETARLLKVQRATSSSSTAMAEKPK